MDFWVEQVKSLAKKCQDLHTNNPVRFEPLKIHLLLKYVDDCFVALTPMKLGSRWDPQEKAMIWTLEKEKEDREAGVSPQANTMRQFSLMASSVTKTLRFTFDIPENNQNGRMPVLDTQIWVGKESREVGIPKEIMKEELNTMKNGKLKDVILFSFFKKPMANPVPNRQISASPDGQKFATISQEIIR